ncbi:proteasome ATPase, partial [Kibdelosporangium lantanae]
MQHDRPGSRPEEADDHSADEGAGRETSQSAQIRFLEEEIALLRRKLTESPRHVRLLEQRLAEASERVGQLTERNTKLVDTLREARSQLLALREEVDRLAQPPSGYGVYLAGHEDGTVDVFTAGRRMRVAVSPAVEIDTLKRGQSVRLNEALTVVE